MYIKRFIKEHNVVCKISIFSHFGLKANSKSVLVNLKTLWKAIKSLGQANKFGGCIVAALAENQIVKNDTKSILKTFNSFYSKLAVNLLANLSKSSN